MSFQKEDSNWGNLKQDLIGFFLNLNWNKNKKLMWGGKPETEPERIMTKSRLEAKGNWPGAA